MNSIGKKKSALPHHGAGRALCCIFLSALLAGGLSACGEEKESAEQYFVNLAEGCTAAASAEEDASLAGAAMAVDGDSSTMWMAGNESNQLVVDFGVEETFSYLRLLWGSVNITSYSLEASDDGENFSSFFTSDVPPYLEEDLIDLRALSGSGDDQASGTSAADAAQGGHVTAVTSSDGTVSCRYLRLSVTGAALIRELQVYPENPWDEVEEKLSASIVPESGEVSLEGLPDGITAEYGGCNYEQIIDEEGGVHYPLEEKTVQAGWNLTWRDWTVMTKDLPVVVPAGQTDSSVPDEMTEAVGTDGTETAANGKPAVVPVLQEWKGGTGNLALTEETRKAIEELSSDGTGQLEVTAGDTSSDSEFLGEEGYEIVIGDEGIRILVSGQGSGTGILWAFRTLQQMMEQAEQDAEGRVLLPEGTIRDYPEYPSRGLEIDVARSFVSMESLYRIAERMSRFKMNELTVHLNDNEILSSAGYSSAEEALQEGYAAYRMESSLSGEDEETAITAADGSYTREEFAEFTDYAASIGVSVIPEIDTPAHSLAFTRAFPELAETYEPAAVQYLDLSKEETLQLIEEIWTEQLEPGTEESAAFDGCGILHIGGDEYYGAAADYVNYENGLIRFVKENGRTPRLWGSLSRIRNAGDTRVETEGTQMILWNSWWADPGTMLRAGFSLINADSSCTYIVPGSANDVLDEERFGDTYHVNTPFGCVLPSWSQQVLGGQITLWNDYSRTLGISEDGILDRIEDAIPAAAGRFWMDE